MSWFDFIFCLQNSMVFYDIIIGHTIDLYLFSCFERFLMKEFVLLCSYVRMEKLLRSHTHFLCKALKEIFDYLEKNNTFSNFFFKLIQKIKYLLNY